MELGGDEHSRSTRFETLFDVAEQSWSFWSANQPIYWDTAANTNSDKHTALVEPMEYIELDSCNTYDSNVFDMVSTALENSSWVEQVRATRGALVHVEFVSPDCESDDAEVIADGAATGRLIEQLTKKFAKAFPDGRTTFVVTSDHGTLSGRHGWSDPALTHVPVVAWGPGVADPQIWQGSAPPHCEWDSWCHSLLSRLLLGTMLKDRFGEKLLHPSLIITVCCRYQPNGAR